MELACLVIVLLEEGDITRCPSAVMNACEAPATYAEASQLTALLVFAWDNHCKRLFLALTMLTTYMLAQPFRLHVPLPSHRLFFFTPSSLIHDYLSAN